MFDNITTDFSNNRNIFSLVTAAIKAKNADTLTLCVITLLNAVTATREVIFFSSVNVVFSYGIRLTPLFDPFRIFEV